MAGKRAHGQAAFPAASARSQAMGLRMPGEECLRVVLYSSIQAAALARAWALVAKCWTRRSSHSRVECQDAITALPRADPGRPIDWQAPSRWQAAGNDRAVYSLPWSVWKMTPGAWPPRTATAIARAP